jgi:hypothetical protein
MMNNHNKKVSWEVIKRKKEEEKNFLITWTIKSCGDSNAVRSRPMPVLNCQVYPSPDPTRQGGLDVTRNLSCHAYTHNTPLSAQHMLHYVTEDDNHYNTL